MLDDITMGGATRRDEWRRSGGGVVPSLSLQGQAGTQSDIQIHHYGIVQPEPPRSNSITSLADIDSKLESLTW